MKRAISLIFFLLHGFALAQSTDTTLPAVIRPGTIEIGLDGSLMSVEGLTRISMMLRGGTFLALSPVLLTGEAEAGYSYMNALGALDLQFGAGITQAIGGRSVWPYLAFSGGIRQEWVGSFSQVRYPVGGDLGVRVMLSRAAGLRIAYRYRYILNDPVAAFQEHRLLFGASIFLE